jgi:hypothetical protein
MSEVLPSAPHEFWRPPAATQPASAISISTGLAEVCKRCGGEFMVGSYFCHICGTERQSRTAALDMGWTRYLEVQNIKASLALSSASFVALLVGVACMLAALMVGVIYNVQNFGDFQAVQFWRMQWLLGAVAAFVAGILLKRDSKP